MKRPAKATNRKINRDFLRNRAEYSIKLGYKKQKWVIFCEAMLEYGFELELYEARQTVSKYITVIRENKKFKVRFSDHKPIMIRELRGDCDYFVGRTNLGIQTTPMAINEAIKYFAPLKPYYQMENY